MSNKISWINNSLQSSRAAPVGPIPYLQWLTNYVNCVDADTYVHMTMQFSKIDVSLSFIDIEQFAKFASRSK